MARKSKWVEVQSPQEPVADVARRALGDRLQIVWRYLQRASHGAPTDTENVHQLRVSSRRAVAAMEIFDALLPRRRQQWMSKQLKRVRQAAGAARDLDVILARFRPQADEESVDDRFDALVHYLKVRRQRAQDPIDAIYEKLDQKRFRRRVRGLVQRARLRSKQDRFEEPTFFDAARTAMEPMVVEFFRAAGGDFADYTALHAFRIQGKHLRYAMEVFAGAFEPSFREELYPLVAALQERLGQVNDHATARELFALWLTEDSLEESLRTLLESLVAEEQSALETKRDEFVGWWSKSRQTELQRRFAEVGLRPSSAPPESEFVLRRAE
jgi:CHAD domain-containing protein